MVWLMTETKVCPKCGNVMTAEDNLQGYGPVRLVKNGDWRGDKVIPFYCRDCGNIERYKEKNLK